MRSNSGSLNADRTGTATTSPINDPHMNLTWLGFCDAAEMKPNPREYDTASKANQHQYEQGRHVCAFIRRVLNLEPASLDVPVWRAFQSFEEYMTMVIPPHLVQAILPEFEELMNYLAQKDEGNAPQRTV